MRREVTKNTSLQPGPRLPEPRRRREKVYLRTKNSRLRAFLFVGICALMTVSMTSCFDQGDCIFTSSNFVRIDFANVDTTSKARLILVDSILIPGKVVFKADTVIANSTYLIGIDPNETQTEFVFYWQGHVDRLVVSYTTQSQVLGLDCGTYQFINDLAVVSTTFSHVTVVGPKVRVDYKTKVPAPNVQILL
jgi:hypothetical protein